MATDELNKIIGMLKRTSGKFNALYQEALSARFKNEARKNYENKLIEQGRLLIDLEKTIAVPLSDLERTKKGLAIEIRNKVAAFAWAARTALKDQDMFWLGTLLRPKNFKDGDRNDLEKLIEDLESKKQQRFF